jgi:hypothetical protein
MLSMAALHFAEAGNIVLPDVVRRKYYDHPIYGSEWKRTLTEFDQRTVL